MKLVYGHKTSKGELDCTQDKDKMKCKQEGKRREKEGRKKANSTELLAMEFPLFSNTDVAHSNRNPNSLQGKMHRLT